MSQRVQKVESLIQQVVASQLPVLIGRDAARVTVTAVDASPDLRNATVWLGILGDKRDPEGTKLFEQVVKEQTALQTAVAKTVTMKYSPRLHLKSDSGGAYAEQISRALQGL
jgi:ribosome-binding factor A